MLQVVWLKRDIRIFDHAPLAEAAKSGPVFIIYVLEPSIWQAGDLSKRHLAFVIESLRALSFELEKRGGKLFYAVGEMEHVLDSIYDTFGTFQLLAHEENGTPLTFERDKRVHAWTRQRGLAFKEFQQFGVTRRLKSRSMFNHNWQKHIYADVIEAPLFFQTPSQIPHMFSSTIDIFKQLEVPGEWLCHDEVLKGGEHLAHRQLNRFIEGNYKSYLKNISSPYLAEKYGSRLSPYLAWGNISLRYVVQRCEEELNRGLESWAQKAMLAFLSRCHWHCHFIQRIEDQPEIVTTTLNPAFDSLRQHWDEELFQKWAIGQTGVPLIDAGMRALIETGWVNFRLRAILVSFVCNTLMLDWRRPAEHLARMFIDYEPGIHYSQVQMQAGITGFNTIRIYNPYKQAEDHDKEGKYVRKYSAERDRNEYDMVPIVDVEQANRIARELLWSTKRQAETRENAKTLLEKHGSRKRPAQKLQIEIDFD